MNERLRELAEQAGLDFEDDSNLTVWDCNFTTETDVENFAKLIVQECIQQLEIGKKCDPYTGELFTCEHNDNIDYQIKVLKEHFEVGFPEKFQTSMSLPVMRQAFDAIVNVLAGGDFDNPLCDLKQAALALQQAIAEEEKPVHASDMSEKHVHKSDKNEHENWYGQWQWRCGYERGWDKAMEREWVGLTDDELEELEVSSVDRKWGHLDASLLSRSIEAKLKEKNNG